MVWISLNLSYLNFSKVHESVGSYLVQNLDVLVIVSSNTLSTVIASKLSEILLTSFFSACFLYYSHWVNFIDLSSNLMILSSVSSTLLLSWYVCIYNFCLLLHSPLNFFVSFFFLLRFVIPKELVIAC